MPETHQYYVEHGICPTCHKNPPEPGRRRCAKCLEKHRQEAQRKRSKARSKNICPTCNKNSVSENQIICDSCKTYTSDYAQKRRKERAFHSQCSECGEPLLTTKYKTCSKCRTFLRERKKSLYWEHVQQGLCPECLQPRNQNSLSKIYCTNCYIAQRTRRIHVMSINRYGGLLEQIIERDKGCVVCGRLWEENGEGSMQVVCHHIDNNTSHNTLSNLIMLCRNCHTLVTAWTTCSNTINMLKFLLKHYPTTSPVMRPCIESNEMAQDTGST